MPKLEVGQYRKCTGRGLEDKLVKIAEMSGDRVLLQSYEDEGSRWVDFATGTRAEVEATTVFYADPDPKHMDARGNYGAADY